MKKPYEVLKEEMKNQGLIQRELALRTGVSEKHISTVLSGSKSISPSCAKKLEYVLGISASYWLSLESDYALFKIEDAEKNSISEEEYAIFDTIKEVISELENLHQISRGKTLENKILYTRHYLRVSSLCELDGLKHILTNQLLYKSKMLDAPYLYAFSKLIDVINKKIPKCECEEKRLILKLFEIKSYMFHDENQILNDINYLLNDIGIQVNVIKDFGRENQIGMIVKNDNQSYSVFVSAKDNYADIFWFKLFHLLSLIAFNKVEKYYFDYLNSSHDVVRATSYAKNILLNQFNYRDFINEKDFSLKSISSFSEFNNVCNFIVIGRLKEEGYLDKSAFPRERIKYHF